jgi:vacuolar-type H+-ATPase subunit I/STV1
MKKGYWTVIGYIMLLFGFLSLLLSMVGLELTFMKGLNVLGSMGKFLVQLLMIFGGVVVMYLSRLEVDPEDLKD